MKRPVKLAVMALVLAVLIIATIVLNAGNERRAAAEETDFTLFSASADTLSAFGWECGGEQMSFIRTAEGWSYDSDPSFPLDKLKVSNAISSLSEVIAHKSFKPGEELSQYGLEPPLWKIECTGGDGSVTVLSLGNTTGLEGYRYLSLGDGNVYLVDASITDNLAGSLTELAELEQLPSMADAISMTVSAGNVEYRISRPDADSGFVLDCPGVEALALDTELAGSFIRTVTYDMLLQNLVCWNASGSDLSVYGLDEPAMDISVEYLSPEKIDTGMLADDGGPVYDTVYNEELFRFQVGCTEDGLYFGRIYGSELIYQIASTVYQTLYSMTPEALTAAE